MTTEQKCVRILCLHGYRQNSQIFHAKLGALRKMLKNHAQLVFIDAPHRVQPISPNTSDKLAKNKPESDEGSPLSEGTAEDSAAAFAEETSKAADNIKWELSWWFNKDDRTFKGTNKNGPAYGFDESLAKVEEVWKNRGPFEGLLGFSQGACFVGLICMLARKHLTTIKPEFAIMCAGFVSQSLAHHRMYDGFSSMPSLHIAGTSDELITPEMSHALLGHFNDGQLIKHDGGHFFPATAAMKKKYLKFMKERVDEHFANTNTEKKIVNSEQ